MIMTEFMKEQFNRNRRPHTFFWRDKTGHEVDCLIERGQYLFPIEIKAGQTITSDYFEGLEYWNALAKAPAANSNVIYAGTQKHVYKEITVSGWNQVAPVFDKILTL